MKAETGALRIEGDMPQLSDADKDTFFAGGAGVSYNRSGLNVTLPVGPKRGLAAWPFKRLDCLWWACGLLQVVCLMVLAPIGAGFLSKGQAFGLYFLLSVPVFVVSYAFQQGVLVPAMFPPEHSGRA